jgi:hypothetical protein
MPPADADKEKAAEDDLRKAVEDLKKNDATEDLGDMPVDSSLGRPETENGKPERIQADDDEN